MTSGPIAGTTSEALQTANAQLLREAEKIVGEAVQLLSDSKQIRLASPRHRRAYAEAKMLGQKIEAYDSWIRAIDCELRILEIDERLAQGG